MNQTSKIVGIKLFKDSDYIHYVEISKEDPFRLFDKYGNQVYQQTFNGFWWKKEFVKTCFVKSNNWTYFENSHGRWSKRMFGKNNNIVSFEDAEGVHYQKYFDENNNQLYFENKEGYCCLQGGKRKNILFEVKPWEKH